MRQSPSQVIQESVEPQKGDHSSSEYFNPNIKLYQTIRHGHAFIIHVRHVILRSIPLDSTPVSVPFQDQATVPLELLELLELLDAWTQQDQPGGRRHSGRKRSRGQVPKRFQFGAPCSW